MNLETIPLSNLHAHPANSNVMSAEMLGKLVSHLRRSDRYPPLIVRRMAEPNQYQILDGHHRALALNRIGRDSAQCTVWDVDDSEALLLLATLNRLQGQDDPRKRAQLLAQLQHSLAETDLARKLPESREKLQRLLALAQGPPPTPRPPQLAEQLPTPVHFFLLPEQKKRLEARLSELGGTREQALMKLVETGETSPIAT